MKSYFYRLSPSVLPLVFFLFFVNLVSSKSHSTQANFINSGNSVELLSSKSNSSLNKELLFFQDAPSKSKFPTQKLSEAVETWEESDSDDEHNEFSFLEIQKASYKFLPAVIKTASQWPVYHKAVVQPLHKLHCVFLI